MVTRATKLDYGKFVSKRVVKSVDQFPGIRGSETGELGSKTWIFEIGVEDLKKSFQNTFEYFWIFSSLPITKISERIFGIRILFQNSVNQVCQASFCGRREVRKKADTAFGRERGCFSFALLAVYLAKRFTVFITWIDTLRSLRSVRITHSIFFKNYFFLKLW